MKTLKSKEDEVLDDFVNRATNAAELQQEIIVNLQKKN